MELVLLTALTVGLLAAACCYALGSFCSKRTKRIDRRQVVLVTGAASGLGLQVVSECLAAGHKVVALDISQEALEKICLAANADSRITLIPCDVSDYDSLVAAAQSVQARLGPKCLDCICNFAGVLRGGPLVELEPSDMKLVMDVNVLGTFNVNRAFFPLLNRRKGGSLPKIIIVASEITVGWLSACFNAPYSMSKFAVEAYATALRQELSLLEAPVRVVTINPGAFKTPMVLEQQAGGPNAFFERAARKPGTLFAESLLKGAVLAQGYMRRNGNDPELLGSRVLEILDLCEPLPRYIIGATFEMRWIVPLVPQFLLDAVLAWQIR
eukprot:TRINITY_DN67781_c0_g1_i1.p1 TRINITY_DN67781_c0_g1~~TRINITY_DN67781_c0_g1_i1.p1  ORF type:complete len:365 (+),score=35.10 TRINITY_DN67781_c0_g1_i1:118-1095(+)